MKKDKPKAEVGFPKEQSSTSSKWSRLFSRIIRMPKWRQADEVALVLFSAFIITTTLYYFNEWKFSEEEWKHAIGERYKIVDDLIDSNILTRKSKQEVLWILGEPDLNENSGNKFIYELGRPPAFFEEKDEKLHIIFENHKVKKISIEID